MAYTVVIDGVHVQCETAAEAAELARLAAGAPARTQPNRQDETPGGSSESRWTKHRVQQFFGLIKGQQRKLIDALLDSPDGQTDDQLLKLLGLADGRALAGVFTGLYKNAKKTGADPNELYRRDRMKVGDSHGWEYSVADSFRTVARSVRSEE